MFIMLRNQVPAVTLWRRLWRRMLGQGYPYYARGRRIESDKLVVVKTIVHRELRNDTWLIDILRQGLNPYLMGSSKMFLFFIYISLNNLPSDALSQERGSPQEGSNESFVCFTCRTHFWVMTQNLVLISWMLELKVLQWEQHLNRWCMDK